MLPHVNLRTALAVCLGVFLPQPSLFAQAPPACLDGIVNAYTPVTAFGCDSSQLTTGALTGFAPGDKVLLVQMQAAQVDLSNTDAFGTLLQTACVGNYEFNRIHSIAGNQVQLQFALSRPYDLSGRVQLVRVPEYEDATACDLTCLPWDGTVGGILVVDVKNRLKLTGEIDVSGKGFRGGQVVSCVPWIFGETQFFYPPDPNVAAAKGEGLVLIPATHSYGRGRAGTGGGGGNAHNGGGGGGANAGSGGRGGLELCNLPAQPAPHTDGIGGKECFRDDGAKILLGGGGGAGHTNDELGSGGGNGGGIVIIEAGILEAGGHPLRANGQDVLGGDLHKDGQGGGGAGGTVLLAVGQLEGALPAELRGGRGGSCPWVPDFQLHGPGGGGSGGKILASQNFSGLSAALDGGINGLTSQDMTNGALPGEPGQLLTGLVLAVDTVPATASGTLAFTVVPPHCAGGQDGRIELQPVAGALFQLDDGPAQASPVFDSLAAGTYQLTMELPGGCQRDAVVVIQEPPALELELLMIEGADCHEPGQLAVQASSGTPPFQYQLDGEAWQNQGFFSNLEGGAYPLTLRDGGGCTLSREYLIPAAPPLEARVDSLGPVRCGRPTGFVSVSASGGSGGYVYRLENGPARASGHFAGLSPGVYTVIVTDSIGCEIELSDLAVENLADTAQTHEVVTIYEDAFFTLPDGRRTGVPGLFPFVYQTWQGCDSVHIIEVRVLPRQVYVPNAFHPGSDGQNALFTVYSDASVAVVRRLHIYDRWGNLLFDARDLPPNAEERGWDGRSRGRLLTPGLFVWIAEVEFADGLQRTYRGDVTLIL
jgi:gliding motility-associated-like protein